MEEEIDLREYIEVLIKNWYWIVSLGLAAAALAFLVSSSLPPTYKAESRMLILQSSIDISFEPTIRSKIDESQGDQATLTGLVKSSTVAEAVLQAAQGTSGFEVETVTDLLRKVETSTNGNLILISVTDKDPAVAAQLADLWATTAEHQINHLFNRNDALLAEVQAQVAEVAETYARAQTDLESFTGDNQIPLLERNLASLKQNLAINHELLSQKYRELNQIDAWLQDAYTLRDQLVAGSTTAGASAGDSLALLALRMRGGFLSSSSLPLNLQFTLAEDMVTEPAKLTVGDVDTLLPVIEARRDRIEADIEQLSAILLTTQEPAEPATAVSVALAPQTLAAQITILGKALEVQHAKQRELTQNRDLAWENLKAVQRKLAELQLGLEITDSIVRIADFAIVPEEPVGPRRLLNTAVAGLLGGMIAVVGIFVLEYWRTPPARVANPTADQQAGKISGYDSGESRP